MEELQSTEILDREILEGARKKAHRILKTADDTIQIKSAEWDAAIHTAIGDFEKKYTQQSKIAIDEIMALLSIDKHRIKAKKIEALLSMAIETWYNHLSRQRVLDLLKNELAQRLAECGELAASGEMCVLLYKVEQAEAETIAQAVLPGRDCRFETIHSSSLYPQIILETPQLRIYASIDKTVAFFLSEKRMELIEALLGNAAVLDAKAMGEEA